MPRFPHAAPTSATLSARVFSGLAKKASAMREAGKVVHALSVGDTYKEPLVVARAESQRVADRPGLHRYAPPQGELELLEAVSRRLSRLGQEVPVERIQIVSGATSGLSVVAAALFMPGDEVLLPSPFWPLIRGIISGRGATPVQVSLMDRLDDVDVEATLEAAVTDKTVALYLNTPHNPTGSILGDEHLAAVARVAERHTLWVICDEAYQDLYFGETPARAWQHPALAERAVVCHTLSKSYGIAGSRIGYVHGPKDAMRAIRGVQTFATYCAARPLQFGAAAVLDQGTAWLDERRLEYAGAAERAARAFDVPAPPGGTFLFVHARPWMRDGETDALPFLDRCLDAGVLMTPGGACGDDFSEFFRVCFTGVTPDALNDALARLAPILGTA